MNISNTKSPKADCDPPKADCDPPKADCDPPKADCDPPETNWDFDCNCSELENNIIINNLNEITLTQDNYLIISKNNCIYCDKSKDLFKKNNIKYHVMNCDYILNGQKNINLFLEYMCKLIGYEYMTFPMIFYGKKFIGGYNELLTYLD